MAAADGQVILSHDQARERCREWAKGISAGVKQTSAVLTVDDVLDRYLEARESEGMKSVVDARQRADRHIRPALGKLPVVALTVQIISKWRDGMANAPKQVRTKKGAAPNFQPTDLSDPEVRRRRRDTANRTLTVLKAALNWARDRQLVGDDSAWRLAKPYRATTAARIRFLSAAEQKDLLNATTGRLRDLVAAALVTGARFGELARLQVRDFDGRNGSLFIAESKSGRSRHIPLPKGGAALLAKLCEGRAGDAPILVQENGERWGPATYRRAFGEAIAAAGLEHITFHELRHTYASAMVRAGVLLPVVAEALGHSDARMVSKHYGHLAPSFVADMIRQNAPDIHL